METRTIFFIGKPGCGKGTQAKLLSERTGWPAISSGKLFREIAQQPTVVGRKVREENYAGILQPYWFAMYLYQRELFALPEDTGAIFDGFNRKIQEAELVIDSLEWLARPFQVLHIHISDAVMRERLEARALIEGRPDDNTLETRLDEYMSHTEKAIELFRDKGVLLDINGEQSREAIAADIVAALKLS